VADTVGLIAEVFTWIGVGAGLALLFAALVVRIADGTWLPARGVIEHTDHGSVVRWFDDDGGVNEAALSDHDVRRLDSRDMADIYYRHGWHNRMRLDAGSHAVRALVRLALLMLAVALAAFAAGWIALIAEG
jgi:hypothetical protein